MKRISIVLIAVFFIGIANANAQTVITNKTVVEIEKVKEVKTCDKTGKVCDATCEKKKNGTCCKGDKKKSCSKSKSSCSKSKSSCSKSDKKKGCCKKDAKKCGEDCTKVCCSAKVPSNE